MPLPPDMKVADPDDPYSSLADVHYNAPTSFFANIMDILQHNVFKKLWDSSDASPNIAMLQHFNFNHQTNDYINEYYAREPASPERIAQSKKDRPGIAPPDGIDEHVLELMENNWDREQEYSFMAYHPAGAMSWLTGFVGQGVGAVADPIALGGGGVAGRLTQRLTAPLVKGILTDLAAHETMGAAAGITATKATEFGLHTGAGFAGFSLTEDIADEYKRAAFNQPSDWLGVLLRTGSNAFVGFGLGLAGKGASMALHGYYRPILAIPESLEIPKVPDLPEGMKSTETPITPVIEGYERRGGLLNSETFQDLPAKAKAAIARFKPWSNEADATARVEAMGQGINGQTPDVSLTLRQGAIDEGARFRQMLHEQNVPLTEMDMRLLQADTEANIQLRELATTVEALKKSDRKLIADEKISISGDKDLSQRGIIKRLEKAQFNREMLEAAPETLPDNILKRLDVEERITNINRELAKENLSNTKRKNLQKQLAKAEKTKRKIKIETPREELSSIKKRLLDKGITEDFQSLPDYKRLATLAKVWPQARNLLERVHLERDHQLQLQELINRKLTISSMRKHVNGTHKPVTQEDMKNYGNYLNSPGVERIDYDLPDRIDTTYEAELNKFAESEMQELMGKVDLPEFRAEVEDTLKRRESIPTLKKMAKGLVDCILRNEV